MRKGSIYTGIVLGGFGRGRDKGNFWKRQSPKGITR